MTIETKGEIQGDAFTGRPRGRAICLIRIGGGFLLLEALEGLLVGPGLESEVGLGVEADAKDDDGEEGGDVAGKLPVLPLPRLPRGGWQPIEDVPLGPLLRPRARPPPSPLPAAASGPHRRPQPLSNHASHRRDCLRWKRSHRRIW